MEQNNIVVMIDDEIMRLREVQQILKTLLPVEDVVAPVSAGRIDSVDAVTEQPIAEATVPEADEQKPEPAAVKRHVSRRGISTGRRGPRRTVQPPAPRALDAAIPKAPVVSKPPVVVAKPQAKVEGPPAEGTLEAWVRSLRPGAQPDLRDMQRDHLR